MRRCSRRGHHLSCDAPAFAAAEKSRDDKARENRCRHAETARVRGGVGNDQSNPDRGQSETNAEQQTDGRPAGDVPGDRRRQYEERKDEQCAGDLASFGRRNGQRRKECEVEKAQRQSAGSCECRVDGGEEQRTSDDTEDDEQRGGSGRERHQLSLGNTEDEAEQRVGGLGQQCSRECRKEITAAEDERENCSDYRRFSRRPRLTSRPESTKDPGDEKTADEISGRDIPTQCGRACGPGKGGERDGVAGEALSA